MAQDNAYERVLVKTFVPTNGSGKHGKVHVRPAKGGKYPVTLFVECSKRLSIDYPVGTKFELLAKLTDREDGGQYLYSSYRWAFTVIK